MKKILTFTYKGNPIGEYEFEWSPDNEAHVLMRALLEQLAEFINDGNIKALNVFGDGVFELMQNGNQSEEICQINMNLLNLIGAGKKLIKACENFIKACENLQKEIAKPN